MPTLAIQLDSRGATAVLADPAKADSGRFLGSAVVEQPGEAAVLAERLKQAFPQLRGARPEIAVALGADDVRVRRLPIPPAPPEELPAIVALQAAREANTEAEELVVDFLPPGDGASDPVEAFVAWADRTTVGWWEEVAAKLGGKLVVVTSRPLATLSLAQPSEGKTLVVVSRAGGSIDYAAQSGGTPTLLRSAAVRQDDPGGERRELSRTLLSLTDAEPQVFVSEPGEGESIDWGAVVSDTGGDVQTLQSLQAGAAVGLLRSRCCALTPSLNLADPRRPPPVESGKRRQVLLAATAATVLLAGGWMAYERLADIDRQIEVKRAEIAEAEQALEAFEPYRERVASIDAWRATDVTWLDEIERLGRKLRPLKLDSKDFPVESDVRVSRLHATIVAGRGESGGKIELTATARSSSTRELEARLRDATHPVEPISIAENPSGDEYRFDYTALLRSPAATEQDGSDEPTAGGSP